MVIAHAYSRAVPYGRLFKYPWNLSKKLSSKWGVGQYSIVGPLSQGYGNNINNKIYLLIYQQNILMPTWTGVASRLLGMWWQMIEELGSYSSWSQLHTCISSWLNSSGLHTCRKGMAQIIITSLVAIYLPCSQKILRGIKFGGLAV